MPNFPVDGHICVMGQTFILQLLLFLLSEHDFFSFSSRMYLG